MKPFAIQYEKRVVWSPFLDLEVHFSIGDNYFLCVKVLL